MTTYFLALLWYRFSDYWQTFLDTTTPESRYFVVFFNLRPINYTLADPDSHFKLTGQQSFDGMSRRLFQGEDWDMHNPSEDLNRLTEIHERLITCMYYALTTLATVGYGDYYPSSISEKILGSIIQIFGVTFFSILMNNFIDVVLSMKSSNFNDNEDQL